MTDFWCDAKLVWLCECAWLEMDVVALAAQRSWGGAGWLMPLKLPFHDFINVYLKKKVAATFGQYERLANVLSTN